MKKNDYDTKQLNKKIIEWGLFIKGLGLEWTTGIYPGEMAAFLALCELEGVNSILESGRGDHAYSTQILAEYGMRKGIQVISMDVTPVSKKGFKDRLKEYENLRCLTGDSFNDLPRAMRRLPGKVALLVDGPKMELANRLSFTASAMYSNICIVAHHNCLKETSWGTEFAETFPEMFHYETLGLDELVEWREFKNWEEKWVGGYELYDEVHQVVGRSLKTSSLAMAVIRPEQRPTRSQVFRLHYDDFKYRPAWLWVKWSLLRWF